jgi:hypothetical protein
MIKRRRMRSSAWLVEECGVLFACRLRELTESFDERPESSAWINALAHQSRNHAGGCEVGS